MVFFNVRITLFAHGLMDNLSIFACVRFSVSGINRSDNQHIEKKFSINV